MSLNKVIIAHKNNSIHEEPVDGDLKFRFLEQTKEVVTDKHLKSLFEMGDKPTGVDFELLINSKVHQTDFQRANIEIYNKIDILEQDIKEEITNTSNEIYDAIDNLDEELSNDLFEATNSLKEELSNDLSNHTSNKDIHFTTEERVEVAKIPNLELAINNLNTIIGGVARQHIVNTIEERDALSNLINADICHVIDTQETYMYNLENTTWIKVSDFNSLVSVDWSIIQNIPTEFNPTSHIHTIDDIENLRDMLEALSGGDMSGFVKKEDLESYTKKEELDNYSFKNHTHSRLDLLEENCMLGEATEFNIIREDDKFIIKEIAYQFGNVQHQNDIISTDFGSRDIHINKNIVTDKVETNSLVVNGKNVYISSDMPSSPEIGDIWIEI